jgi:hypothetical protein
MHSLFYYFIYRKSLCTCLPLHLHARFCVVNTFSGFCSKPSHQIWKRTKT